MKYKILVLDVDGTLTNSEKQISEKTKKALMHAQKKGVKLVIASGRPTFGVMPFVKELEMEKYGGYVLSFNGAKITDCKTGKIMYEDSISPEMVPAIYDISKKHGVNILTYEGDTVITETLDDEYLQIELRINKMIAKKVDNFKDYVKFSVPKFIMLGDGDYLGKIEPDVAGKLSGLNVYRSEPFFLEVMPQNIDKAYSLGRLLEKLGLSKDEMIACGDGFNDKSMIMFAGLGVAMENAQPPVKEVADYITLSNNHDGIAKVVEEFILA